MQVICIELISLYVQVFIPSVNEHCGPCVRIFLPLSLPFIFYYGCDFNWLRLFINSVYSLYSFSAHFVFFIKPELVILFQGSKHSQCILHYLNFQTTLKITLKMPGQATRLKQVARTSHETPETKFLKILSKCFSRLKVPPVKKSQREPRKILCNLRDWSFHP